MDKNILKEKGWDFEFDYADIISYNKGDIKKDNGNGVVLEINKNTKLVTISTTDKGYKTVDVVENTVPNISVKFKGYIENIDDLDYVCKLIKIK